MWINVALLPLCVGIYLYILPWKGDEIKNTVRREVLCEMGHRKRLNKILQGRRRGSACPVISVTCQVTSLPHHLGEIRIYSAFSNSF